MTKKKAEPVENPDADLDALVAECEKCKEQCQPQPAMQGAADGEAVPQPKAIDPATILAIVDVVLKLVEAFRKRRQS